MNKDFFIKSLKTMSQIRAIENLFAEHFKKNKNSSFLHLSAGQEASAVGVCAALKNKDLVFGNHRSHGHYVAKGSNIFKMIYEVLGDTRGCCKGNGGSMHMLDKKKGFMGTTPILGSAAPIAAGIAMSQKIKKKNFITVVFLGDGAAEEGSFYETLNIASLYKLPLLIVIEDNNYSVEVPSFLRKAKNYNLKKIVEGFSPYYKKVNGQDFVKIYSNVKKLKKLILKNNKPGILHLKVLRTYAHSGFNIDTQNKYRQESVKDHKIYDPILILKKIINRKFRINTLKIEQIISNEKKIMKKIFFKTLQKIKDKN
jgi:TPP-dependent pyruvate/acetoin dehydrogenase alpha subunit